MSVKRKAEKGRKKKRSVENPSVPLSLAFPDDETYDALGASRLASGVRFSQKKALGYPAVWRAVSLIAGDVAKTPLCVYRLSGENGENKTIDRTHPAYRLLRYNANEYLLSFHLKQILTFHALFKGNGYAYIDRKGPRPVALLILDPDRVEPIRVEGELWYVWKPAGSGMKDWRRIPAADILHIKGLGYDGLAGYPVLTLLRESLAGAIASRDYSARYYGNSARPGGVIKHPSKLSPNARKNMRESWERLHKGLDNSHKIAILEEGCEFISMANNAKDTQLLESRAFDSREVANIFGVPAHKLGDPSKVAYNSLDSENQAYYDDTLSTWLGCWSAEGRDKLLDEKQKAAESHTVDFDYHALKREPHGVTAYGTAAIQNGWENPDEIRVLFGRNAIPGGAGNQYKPILSPSGGPTPSPSAVPAVGQSEARSVVAPRPLDGLRALILDTSRRMARRFASHALRYKPGSPFVAAEYRDFLVGIKSEHSKVMAEAFSPILAVRRDLGVDSLLLAEECAATLMEHCAESLASAGHERASASVDDVVEWVSGKMVEVFLKGIK